MLQNKSNTCHLNSCNNKMIFCQSSESDKNRWKKEFFVNTFNNTIEQNAHMFMYNILLKLVYCVYDNEDQMH